MFSTRDRQWACESRAADPGEFRRCHVNCRPWTEAQAGAPGPARAACWAGGSTCRCWSTREQAAKLSAASGCSRALSPRSDRRRLQSWAAAEAAPLGALHPAQAARSQSAARRPIAYSHKPEAARLESSSCVRVSRVPHAVCEHSLRSRRPGSRCAALTSTALDRRPCDTTTRPTPRRRRTDSNPAYRRSRTTLLI